MIKNKYFKHCIIKLPVKLMLYSNLRNIYDNKHLGGKSWKVTNISAGVCEGLLITVDAEKELIMFCPCGYVDINTLSFAGIIKLLSRFSFHWVRGKYVYYDMGEWINE